MLRTTRSAAAAAATAAGSGSSPVRTSRTPVQKQREGDAQRMPRLEQSGWKQVNEH